MFGTTQCRVDTPTLVPLLGSAPVAHNEWSLYLSKQDLHGALTGLEGWAAGGVLFMGAHRCESEWAAQRWPSPSGGLGYRQSSSPRGLNGW